MMPLESILDYFLSVWFMASMGMSFALVRHHPQMGSWDNMSRSFAWPVTLWEIKTDRL